MNKTTTALLIALTIAASACSSEGTDPAPSNIVEVSNGSPYYTDRNDVTLQEDPLGFNIDSHLNKEFNDGSVMHCTNTSGSEFAISIQPRNRLATAWFIQNNGVLRVDAQIDGFVTGSLRRYYRVVDAEYLRILKSKGIATPIGLEYSKFTFLIGKGPSWIDEDRTSEDCKYLPFSEVTVNGSYIF